MEKRLNSRILQNIFHPAFLPLLLNFRRYSRATNILYPWKRRSCEKVQFEAENKCKLGSAPGTVGTVAMVLINLSETCTVKRAIKCKIATQYWKDSNLVSKSTHFQRQETRAETIYLTTFHLMISYYVYHRLIASLPETHQEKVNQA